LGGGGEDKRYVCLFPKCEQADTFNTLMMSKFDIEVTNIPAILPGQSHRPSKKRKYAKAAAGKRKKSETGGLEEVLKVGKKAMVMLRRNLGGCP